MVLSQAMDDIDPTWDVIPVLCLMSCMVVDMTFIYNNSAGPDAMHSHWTV